MHTTLNRLLPWLIVFSACGSGTPEESASTANLSPTVPSTLTVSAPVHYIDSVAREPMLVEHPSGALFVSGYGSQVTGVDPKALPNLWKSDDGGGSWNRVDIGTPEDGAIGNSDVDLAVGPDGTLYFVSMGFDRTARAGTHITIGVSHDVGDSWSWTLLSEDHFDDRPWVRVAPDGTAHVVWNDGSGVSYAVSEDKGETWAERQKVYPQGGSSHMAVGPNGELAVRITPISASANNYDEGLELIAISTDGGKTWSQYPAPSDIEWDPTFSDPNGVPRWVEPLAWDANGDLYHLWSEGQVVKLARSKDQGPTWEEWIVAEEDELAYFPYLVARGPGELAATWFSGGGETMAVEVALIRAPESSDSEPQVLRAESIQPDTWQERADQRIRDPGGEYVPIAFLSDGALAVATTVQDTQGDRFGFSWWRIEAN
jgi:hypothetical protein